MTARAPPQAILFDLGNVLLPFDQERRIAALIARFACQDETARAFMSDAIHWRISLGEANEADLVDAFAAAFGQQLSPLEAEDLLLSVFEPPNLELWALAARLRDRAVVGGFSDNPRFVDRLFPADSFLEPMFFSSEIRAFKPTPDSFAAVRRRSACRTRRSSSSTTPPPTSRRRGRAAGTRFTSPPTRR